MSILLSSWTSLLRIVVVGVLAYFVLITVLRVSGKRTLSKLNAFDLIVTVALGSTLATVLLSKDTSLADGALAFIVLIAMQYALTWMAVRSDKVNRLIKAEPRLMLFRGRMLDRALREERVTRGEVEAVVRQEGLADLKAVEAVVLETDGSFSVVPRPSQGAQSSALDSVANYPARAGGRDHEREAER